jgi:nucleotide sugar dehydrogenase
MKIGIIGFGYVGSAVGWAHRKQDQIIRDPKLKDSQELSEFVNADAIFVCLPSPMLEDGRCDTSYLENGLDELMSTVRFENPIPIICKTTAPPTVYAKLHKKYPNIVYSPEFLTAANHIADYGNAEFFVIGGHPEWCERAREVIRTGVTLTDNDFVYTDIKTASMFKYMMNSYMSTKVTFMNDFYFLCQAQGIEWKTMKKLAALDGRIGRTHMDVPGPDGQFGYGGACFPKDVAAIITEAIDLDVDFELLQRVETINRKHRGHTDD